MGAIHATPEYPTKSSFPCSPSRKKALDCAYTTLTGLSCAYRDGTEEYRSASELSNPTQTRQISCAMVDHAALLHAACLVVAAVPLVLLSPPSSPAVFAVQTVLSMG